MRVLVAEDDQDQLELRSLLLAQNGFEAIPVRDSAAALRAAADQKPDCAVVDLRLPAEEHGLSLIRALKSLDTAMRIIVLTGVDAARLKSRPEHALVDRVITKGASSAQLVETIRAWELQRRAAEAQLAARARSQA